MYFRIKYRKYDDMAYNASHITLRGSWHYKQTQRHLVAVTKTILCHVIDGVFIIEKLVKKTFFNIAKK